MPSSLWAPLPLSRLGARALQHRLTLDHGFSHRQPCAFAQALRPTFPIRLTSVNEDAPEEEAA
jgi:hypothetical protein